MVRDWFSELTRELEADPVSIEKPLLDYPMG